MIYLLDSDQLSVLQRVKTRLYDEMTQLTADDRRDLANTLDAVLHGVLTYGALTEDAEEHSPGFFDGLAKRDAALDRALAAPLPVDDEAGDRRKPRR